MNHGKRGGSSALTSGADQIHGAASRGRPTQSIALLLLILDYDDDQRYHSCASLEGTHLSHPFVDSGRSLMRSPTNLDWSGRLLGSQTGIEWVRINLKTEHQLPLEAAWCHLPRLRARENCGEVVT